MENSDRDDERDNSCGDKSRTTIEDGESRSRAACFGHVVCVRDDDVSVRGDTVVPTKLRYITHGGCALHLRVRSDRVLRVAQYWICAIGARISVYERMDTCHRTGNREHGCKRGATSGRVIIVPGRV